MDRQAEAQSHQKSAESRTALLLERGVAAFGALLVCASLGFLLYEALLGDRSPPDLRVEPGDIVRNGSGWLVPFAVVNAGAETAAAARIVGTLTPPQGEPQQAEVTLDYVPGSSATTGGLFFTIDPAQGVLELRATGYQNP